MLLDGPVWLSIGSIFTSSIVAIAAVWLAARFAANQSHLNRVWERKAEAYSTILEALHEMLEWYSNTIDDETEYRNTDKATKDEWNADYKAARKLLRRSIARQVWLLPSDVQLRVAAMNKEFAEEHESWFDDIDSGYRTVKNALTDIAEFARRDLGAAKLEQFAEKR